eukprot:182700-Alexandrium_andersonii.AAC.1
MSSMLWFRVHSRPGIMRVQSMWPPPRLQFAPRAILCGVVTSPLYCSTYLAMLLPAFGGVL